MKKCFLILLTVFLGISCAWAANSTTAQEVAAIRQLIIKDVEFTRDLQLSKKFSFCSKDYFCIDCNGVKYTYKDYEFMVRALEKNDLEALFYMTFKVNQKREPNPQELAQIKKTAKDPAVRKSYPEFQKRANECSKKSCALVLKTMKFKKIDGQKSTAAAVVEFDDFDEEDTEYEKTVRKRENLTFRKENGHWKFLKRVSSKIK